MNRLTDALYMVRFKVRPGVRGPDPEQPGGREEEAGAQSGPIHCSGLTANSAEMKGTG